MRQPGPIGPRGMEKGQAVALLSGLRRVVPAATALGLVAAVAAHPAAAQLAVGSTGITIGSPGDPPRLAFEAGAFNIIPSNHKDSSPAGYFGAEYRFGDVYSVFSPFVGVQSTSDGAAYGYFGFGIDINLGPNWVLTPNGAAGVFERGRGVKLGSWWEFRTGAELDYKLPDQSRIGIAFHHMSNAGLTKQNPGEESVLAVYSIPFP